VRVRTLWGGLTAWGTQQLLYLQRGTVARYNSLGELGVDSLAAVEVRSWIWKSLAHDVAVMKIIGATSITDCKLFAALS
jgi:hypothetical protein